LTATEPTRSAWARNFGIGGGSESSCGDKPRGVLRLADLTSVDVLTIIGDATSLY
jgi:hypothetical protein